VSELAAPAPLRSTLTRAVVVATGGAASLAAAVQWGASGRTLAAVLFLSVLTVLAAIDIEQRRIPNRIVLPASALLLGVQIAVEPRRTAELLVALFATAAIAYVLVRLNPRGLGMGDAKLALFMAVGLGADVIVGLAVGSVLGAAFGAIRMIRGGLRARRSTFPYAPFLAVGSAVALLFAG
jgi:prepilin signal peptidase PulO-like enzyme (type II secretory pathway)